VWKKGSSGDENPLETVAVARVVLGEAYPEECGGLTPLSDAEEVEVPYSSRAMFHGPAFQRLRHLRRGARGATGEFDADASSGAGELPVGLLHPALLDGVWHALTRANVYHWVPSLPPGHTTFPSQIEQMEFFGPTPAAGAATCEIRLDRFEAGPKRLWFQTEMRSDGRLWMRARLAVGIFPLGPFARLSEAETAAFLERRQPITRFCLSTRTGNVTRLAIATVKALDWLPGTVAHAFATSGNLREQTLRVAVKEHVAQQRGVHPATVRVDEILAGGPAPIRVRWEADEVVVEDAALRRQEDA
jgi:hypothetical protein